MKSGHAFLFDMDGVIVDSNPVHKIALRDFCASHGFELSEQHLREKIYGRTNKDWIPALFGALPPEKVAQYAAEKEALFRELYADTIAPLPGLPEFLEKMKEQGIPCAIATSAPRENVDFTLEKTGLGPFFSKILDESFVTRGKPDPEIYLKTAAALGFDPGKCIVLEDSLSGVASGKAAGCKVIALSTTHTPDELEQADLIIPDFRDQDPSLLISRLF